MDTPSVSSSSFRQPKAAARCQPPALVAPLFVMEDQQRELTLSKKLGPELGQQASGAAGHYSGMTVTGVPPHIAYMMQQLGYLAP